MYHEFFLFSISCYFSYRAHPLPYIPLRTPLLSPALPLLLLLVFHLFHLFLLLVLILLLLLPSFSSSSFSSSSYFSFFLSSSFLSSFFSSFSSCSLAPIVPWLRLRTNSLRIAVHWLTLVFRTDWEPKGIQLWCHGRCGCTEAGSLVSFGRWWLSCCSRSRPREPIGLS